MPTKKHIVQWWIDNDDPFVLDYHEPSCFSCGFYRESWKDWNKTPGLEKAHILAASQGGKATVDNFVILCKSCHKKAPMTLHREDMILWCKNHKSFVALQCEQIEESFAAVGIDIHQLADTFEKENVDIPKLISIALKNVGLHAGKISFSSLACEMKRLLCDSPK